MNLLDLVALAEDLPEKGLRKGQVGTIVERLAPQVYEVEFSGLDGKTSATAALSEELLIKQEAPDGEPPVLSAEQVRDTLERVRR